MKSKYDIRHIFLINFGSVLIAFVPVFAKLIPLPPLQLVFFRSLMAAIFLGLYLKIRRVPIFSSFRRNPLFFLGTGLLLGVHWVYLLTLSLVATAFAHTLLVYCLKFFHASTASVIISIEPFYSIVLAMLILKEYPDANILLGGCIVVGTVLLENLTAGYRSRLG